jgi:hypothetical protein
MVTGGVLMEYRRELDVLYGINSEEIKDHVLS